MPIRVEVPGQGIVEFPDGMTDDQIANAIKSNQPKQESGALKNLALGALRGVGGIGASLAQPVQALAGGALGNNAEMRQNMEANLRGMGANPESLAYQGGKLGAEIAGTYGVGGLAGSGLKAVSQSPKALALAEALRTGGAAKGAPLLTNMLGGAGSAALGTLLVDPNEVETGAVVGAALPVVGKVAGATVDAAKSVAEPFYDEGQKRILSRVLNKSVGKDAATVAQQLSDNVPLVQGVLPTAAEVANSPGLAGLQRGAISANPTVGNELALRQAANNEARIKALQSVTPDKFSAESLRESIANPMYANALDNASVAVTPEIQSILNRPSGRQATEIARKLAAEQGGGLGNNITGPARYSELAMGEIKPEMSGRAFQYIKRGFDDIANQNPNLTGIGASQLNAIKGSRGELIGEIEKQLPEYVAANKMFSELSKPISQSDVLSEILRGGQDFRGNITPSRFNSIAQDATAIKETGRKGATLANTLTPKQLELINALRKDLVNKDFAETAGKAAGSNTVQNMAYANMMDSIGIPTALRGFAPASALGNVAGRFMDLGYKRANDQLSERLANALLSPQETADLLKITTKQSGPKNAPKISPATAALINALSGD